MRIAILGATGRTGRHVVELLGHAGHDVVAVVRSPRKMEGIPAGSVAVADATDAAELADAFKTVDAVVFCVGPVKGESHTIQRDAIAATLTAMTAAGVSRLVTISASGWVVAGDDPLTRYLAKPILRRVLRTANADFEAMEGLVTSSTTQWTIVRPPRLTDKPAHGRYRSRSDGNVRWGFQITRADLAASIVDDLADPTTVGQTISVAS